MLGQIRKLVKDKGFGFIRDTHSGEEYFFHRSQLVIPNQFEKMSEGQSVVFDTIDHPKGPRAVNVKPS